ncbi:MAG: patatin-like phospholipase family protein [Corynebacterium variabile]|uniref:patatin-like phospholipase family protein n=1 Tax=Corynebacterium variabile TaxID=1727 RepID=UPI003FBA6D9D
MTTSTALVCGGGGLPGLAWKIGYLHGAAESGLHLDDSDLTVGTSAGAVAAVLSRTPTALAGAYARYTDPQNLPFEASPSSSTPAGDRLRTMIERTGLHVWPDENLLVTVNSETRADRRVLTSHDGVDLATALSASCAVPWIWPSVTLPDGDICSDAGVLSATHVDLAEDARRVLVLRPVPNLQGDIPEERSVLARALVIDPAESLPDADHEDPRPAAALTGHRQAVDQAEHLRRYLNS